MMSSQPVAPSKPCSKEYAPLVQRGSHHCRRRKRTWFETTQAEYPEIKIESLVRLEMDGARYRSTR